ncbi:hypothetical protein NM688_g4298 [Phlebia brevispora]|uniref:Uncharacterized protein n=1 Tax=Phlebia brevispora TaxID=194682 RepID=A0ACC1T397_9APHY|nr:hypothetical protein NM688_g4298 [Phlebia brevispora]
MSSIMDAIPGFGSDIMEQLPPTNDLFRPLLRANAEEILSFKTKTYKFGATDRHELDIYFPKSTSSGSAPTLFFVYGGGYLHGAKVLDPPEDLKYKNVGAFFAKRGFVTVVANYRVFPGIQFPDPAIDLKDATAWVVTNIDEVNQDADVKADVSKIFLMGHSAGASTVITLLLVPGLIPTNLRERIAGLVLNAGVYDFRGVPSLAPHVISGYFGATPEEVRKTEPLGLLESAPADVLVGFPPVLAVIGEYDFPPIVTSHGGFVPVLKDKIDSSVEELVMKGHNHISAYDCLSSGVGEDWGLSAVEWLKSKV